MSHQPPKHAMNFLRWFCREDYLEEIEGDLIEVFEQRSKENLRKANRYFFWQVIRHFRPDFIRPFKLFDLFRPELLRHNLLISYRSFVRNKTTFLINLTGLSTGLTFFFLICLWVNDELHVDKFLPHDEQLFQVLQSVQTPNGIETIEATPGPLAAALKDELSEVEYATTVIPATFNTSQGVISVQDTLLKAAAKYVSRDFFQVFSYPLLAGDSNRVIANKNDAVISERLAINLFKSPEKAIGQQINWQTQSLSGPCLVSGVFSDPPASATDHFDLVLSYDWYLDASPEGGWADSSPRSYVMLKDGFKPDHFRNKIRNFLSTKDENLNSVLTIQRYSDRYLHDRFENGVVAGGRIEYIRLFLLIGLFILAIASINFMNLSTAKASVRLTDVGVKKVIGASRGQLVIQYLCESLLIAFSSLLLSTFLLAALLPRFNELTGKELQLGITPNLALGLLLVTLITGIIAGIYPAIFLSGHQAVKVLKGKLRTVMGEVWLRKGLIVFQFSVSLLLIVAVIVVYKQINLIQSGKTLGYDRDQVIYFGVDRPGQAFVDALRNIPDVVSVGGGSLTAGKQLGGTSDVRWEGKPADNQTFFSAFWLGYDLIETLGIPVTAGRSFSKSFGSSDQVILNEEAVAKMGLKDPVGKKIQIGGEDREIVGVVKDFHFESFYQAMKPCILLLAPMEYAPRLSIKIRSGSEKPAIAKIKAVFETYYPGLVFDYKFMDEDFQRLYAAENRVSVLSRYFAGLAILISCLGLFGLAMFTADRRRKEIGIRKILGSGALQIIALLTADFTKIVLIAVTVGIPASYWLATRWLNRFALHIELHWWYFVFPAVFALLIAWLTVGLQTIRVALLHPVESLKNN